jgi:hypothetical protein
VEAASPASAPGSSSVNVRPSCIRDRVEEPPNVDTGPKPNLEEVLTWRRNEKGKRPKGLFSPFLMAIR